MGNLFSKAKIQNSSEKKANKSEDQRFSPSAYFYYFKIDRDDDGRKSAEQDQIIYIDRLERQEKTLNEADIAQSEVLKTKFLAIYTDGEKHLKLSTSERSQQFDDFVENSKKHFSQIIEIKEDSGDFIKGERSKILFQSLLKHLERSNNSTYSGLDSYFGKMAPDFSTLRETVKKTIHNYDKKFNESLAPSKLSMSPR